MINKNGLHVHQYLGVNDPLYGLLRAYPWQIVKGFNDTRILDAAAQAGVGIRVFRKFGSDAYLPSDMVNFLSQSDLHSVTHLQFICETGMGYQYTQQLQVIQGMRSNGYSGNFLVGGFAVGNPAPYDSTTHKDGTPHFPDLVSILPLFDLPYVGLGYDGYTSIQPTDPRWAADSLWTIFRTDMIAHCAELHGHPIRFIILTECGFDQCPPDTTTQGGYAKRGISDDQYVAFTDVVAQWMGSRANVLGACHFTYHGTQDWVNAGFDLSESIAGKLGARVLQSNGSRGIPVVLPPTPENSVNLDIPLVNQLPPDNTDPNAYNDCGPASTDMIAKYLSMVPGSTESIQQIKADETGQLNYTGYTYTNELAQWFVDRGVQAYTTTVSDVASTLISNLKQGFPCIYLRYWDLANKTGGHFVVAKGFDPSQDTITFNNPWGGVVDTWSYDQVNSDSVGGWLVVVKKAALNITDLLIQQWRSYKPDVAVNTNSAIFKDWLAKRQAGDHTYGVPTTQEAPYGSGVGDFIQYFTNGIAIWQNGQVTWI